MSITSIKISLFSAVVIRISAYPADMAKPFILKTAKNKKRIKYPEEHKRILPDILSAPELLWIHCYEYAFQTFVCI